MMLKMLCNCSLGVARGASSFGFKCNGCTCNETSQETDSFAFYMDPSTAVSPPCPIVFDQLDAICIRCAALRTSGAAGPSGLDGAA